MRLALNPQLFRARRCRSDTARILEAERLGYDSVWTAEAYGSDAVVPAAWIAARTERIHVGTGIMQIPAPHAGHDGDDRHDARRALRRALPPRPRRLRAPGGRGLARPAVRQAARQDPRVRRDRPRHPPSREARRVPRRVLPDPVCGPAAPPASASRSARSCTAGPTCRSIWPRCGPKNVALAAEIADGWIPVFFSARRPQLFQEWLSAGFRAAGRSAGAGFDIMPMVSVVVGDDVAACRAVVKPRIALYVGGMGARGRNFYNDIARRYGYEEAAQRIQDSYLAGRKDEATAAVPDALVDEVALCGPRERLRETARANGRPPAPPR